MALCVFDDAEGGGGNPIGNATLQHVALGGNSYALKQIREGNRWLGGAATKIEDIVKDCVEGSEAGKVVDLNFHFKFIQEISGLEQYAPNLRTLNLSSNNIAEISGLDGMNRLKELKLYGCQISRISSLEPCRNLSALYLEDNRIVSIEGLDALVSLEHLNLDNNRIQAIGKGLAKLARLKELHLCSNRLSTLAGLTGLSALQVLRVSNNQIADVTADQLRAQNKLDELNLSGNQLTSLSFFGAPPRPCATLAVAGAAPRPHGGGQGGGLEPSRQLQLLPSLASLDVSGNQLTADALRNLPTCMQLSEVSLAENQIADLPTSLSSSWPSVEILDLSGNLLERPESVQRLSAMVSMRELLLEGNPLQEDEEALSKALSGLTSLEYVDDRPFAPAPEPSLGDEEEEADAETFALTKAGGSLERPGSSAGSRPSTAGRPRSGAGSRPTTAGSRPGGAGGAAAVNPLMANARLKLTERRFVNEEQALAWERQTKSGLAAIEKQLHRTEQQIDRDMQDMNRYLVRAERVLKREKELQERRDAAIPEELEDPEPPARPRPAASPAPAQPAPPSRSGRRLREAMHSARGDDGGGDRAGTPDASSREGGPTAPPSRAGTRCPSGASAAFDEAHAAVLQASPRDSGTTSGAEESAAEVTDEDVATGASEGEDGVPLPRPRASAPPHAGSAR
ncbi:unnamed protein product, partial [Prorocentrum cordatum]